jgi:hypothetical protein
VRDDHKALFRRFPNIHPAAVPYNLRYHKRSEKDGNDRHCVQRRRDPRWGDRTAGKRIESYLLRDSGTRRTAFRRIHRMICLGTVSGGRINTGTY